MEIKHNLVLLFEDIKTNQKDGASTLAKKTLLRMKSIISETGDKTIIPEIINIAKSVRPSMPIIKNIVSKLEGLPSEKIQDHIDTLIKNLEAKKKKIVDMGEIILSQFQNIGVVSFSSNINHILSKKQRKNLFALRSDNYAKMFGENVNFVDDWEIENKVEIGIMGADAIVVSDTKTYIVNGYPSENFVKSIKRKSILVFAESEKIVLQNLYSIEEQNLQLFEMKENIHLIIV